MVHARLHPLGLALGFALVAAAACASDAPAPAPVASVPVPGAPAAAGFVTIAFAATEDCPGGEWTLDGLAHGRYPVERHPVPPGRHDVRIESGASREGVGHCAGYGRLTVDVEAGQENVLSPEDFTR